MTKSLKVSVIIAAAGRGERAGFDKNKLLTPLYGAPALWHTLKKFDIPEVDEVIVTSAECDFKEISSLVAPFNFKVVLGGETRTQSVKNALDAVTGDVVLIHDGARPYLSHGLIIKCIEGVKTFGSAVCALPCTDTVATAESGLVTGFLDRGAVYRLQTPQAFLTEEIRQAYSLVGDKNFTDDSSVYRAFCRSPRLIEGEEGNIKLTFASDFLREMPKPISAIGQKVGFGVDVHAFCEGSFVTLAGVKIECERALWAHSDGDVIFHAVTDALLSAAGLKDIGHYFPDTDQKYKNADSAKMCAAVLEEVKKAGYAPKNISVSVQAEKPRLATHIDKMISNLAHVLQISTENVAVAAGTCEHLGFVGEGLGIAAYATVLLQEVTNG